MTDLRSRDDVADPRRARRGAHRPAPSRVMTLLPVLLVLGAVAVLALGVSLVTGLGQSSSGSGASAASTAEPAAPTEAAAAAPVSSEAVTTATSTTAPSSTSSAGASGSSTASSSATSSSASSSTGAAAAGGVDTDVPVVVLNATRTKGLAASTARDLESEGWEVGSTGNERSSAVTTTVVRYPDADLEATARAVAEDLGSRVEVELDPDAESGSVTVVAGSDLD